MFHSEFLKPLALGMMNILSYNSLHCTYGWQEGFLIFSVEDGSFIILAPIKIPEIQLLLDRRFSISIHICLKFLLPIHLSSVITTLQRVMEKSFSVLQEGKKTPRDERKTVKHKEIDATQHKAGNIATLNT